MNGYHLTNKSLQYQNCYKYNYNTLIVFISMYILEFISKTSGKRIIFIVIFQI